VALPSAATWKRAIATTDSSRCRSSSGMSGIGWYSARAPMVMPPARPWVAGADEGV
jgi:hypothetical protein